nr:DUF6716 putative glycosyltransferase [Streptomyces sp. SID5468]
MPEGLLLRGRATPTARQLDEVGLAAEGLREVTAAGFLTAVATTDAEVIVLACVGGTVQAMLHGLAHAWRGRARRPVVVTGYVGVVYEKLTDGLLLRHGADLVLANSPYDAARFRAVYEGVGADPGSVVTGALPFLGGAPHTPRPDGPRTVVLAVQPSVPESREDRRYLLRRAADHARRHTGRQVIVKLRSKPGEHTTHIEEHPYPKLAAGLATPPNLRFAYGPMADVLDEADLLVTVSSTAALEAIHRGIPTAVLTDLGVREALGNHHFLGSGCLASWDQLDAGALPSADAAWAARHGALPGPDPYATVRRRVTELAGGELPPLRPYYTAATAPGYLPALLARHHLDAKGEPLPGSAPGQAPVGRLRGTVHRLVRDAARGAYRHGVQHVAPLIRRWGQL